MLRASWSILFIAVAACVDVRPVRLVAGRSDTVIVNGRASVPLAVRLVDANGIERRARGVHYQLIAGGDVELAKDGHVTCDRRGDAEVAATYGELATRVTVLCRPIGVFRMARVLRLTIGGPPAPLDVGAIGLDGAPAHLRLASHQMNCAALPRTEQQYSCTASDRASVIVHHQPQSTPLASR